MARRKASHLRYAGITFLAFAFVLGFWAVAVTGDIEIFIPAFIGGGIFGLLFYFAVYLFFFIIGSILLPSVKTGTKYIKRAFRKRR